jgi:GH35 family endo-1,4-beta-xylanase
MSFIKVFIFIGLVCITSSASSQKKEVIKSNLINTSKLKSFQLLSNDKGSIKLIKDEGQDVFLISTNTYVNEVHDLSVKLPLIESLPKKGEKILLSFEAKTIESSFETGEAKINWQLSINANHEDKKRQTLSLSNEWRRYYIPFEIINKVVKANYNLSLQFGYPPQKLLIKNISVELYNAATPISTLPKTRIIYEGMEADAQWRLDAIDRIEKIRKGNLKLLLTKNGKPLQNEIVKVELISHQFNWGAAIRAKNMTENPEHFTWFKNAFNLCVLENDLKMKFWDNKYNQSLTLHILEELKKSNIPVKGHVLIWPGYRHMPDYFQNLKDKPLAIKKAIENHLENILNTTYGFIDRWDVLNEVYTNKDLQNIMGSDQILFDAYSKMQSQYPNIKRYINEYGIINKGGHNLEKINWYKQYIKRVDDNTNKAVTGIGIQAHFGTDLTPPKRILEILDEYKDLNKTISISEFTLDIDDYEVRKMYTEDLLIAAFSHPQVNEFLFWGMVGDTKNKVDIFHEDGSLGSMGQAFYDLVHGLWKTKLQSKSNSKGELIAPGYYGRYRITIMENGKELNRIIDHLGEELGIKEVKF